MDNFLFQLFHVLMYITSFYRTKTQIQMSLPISLLRPLRRTRILATRPDKGNLEVGNTAPRRHPRRPLGLQPLMSTY